MRQLATDAAQLLGRVMVLEAEWNGLIDELRAAGFVDPRQVSIAQTDGESAFMRAARSITQPPRRVRQAGHSAGALA